LYVRMLYTKMVCPEGAENIKQSKSCVVVVEQGLQSCIYAYQQGDFSRSNQIPLTSILSLYYTHFLNEASPLGS
jgi:hypothetical protein